MDIDVTIGAGIDVPSMQAEQFQMLLQLAPAPSRGLIPPVGGADCRILGAREGQATRKCSSSTPSSIRRNSKCADEAADHAPSSKADLQVEAVQGRGGLCPGQGAPARQPSAILPTCIRLHGHERAARPAVRTRHRGAACRASGDGRGGHPWLGTPQRKVDEARANDLRQQAGGARVKRACCRASRRSNSQQQPPPVQEAGP